MPVAVALAALLASPLAPVPIQDAYREPHPSIVDVVDAPPPPGVRIGPDGERMLLLESAALPPLADLARPMLRLAGMRIDPGADARWQSSFFGGLSVRGLEGGEPVQVELPEDGRLSGAGWSRDGRFLAYTLVRAGGTELRIAPAADPGAARVVTERLCSVLGGYEWSPGGGALYFFEVPAVRGEAPVPEGVPRGPNVQETAGVESPLATYQDLLANPHDTALFLHYATSVPVRVDLESGERQVLGEPRPYADLEPSPDGRHLLVSYLTGETSYVLPYWRFPERIEAWSADGAVERLVADVPMGHGIPLGGVRTGPRGVEWLAARDATLVWSEALDGGDPDREVPHRDRVVAWAAPFDGEPRELLRVEHRSRGLTSLADPGRLVTYEYDRDRRWVRVLLHDLSAPDAEPRVLEDRSIRDRYADPGNLVMHVDERGRRVPLQHGPWVYRTGSGASPEGYLPFLDRQNLETLQTERLWRCEPGSYERVDEVQPGGAPPAFVTRYETPTVPPNYRLYRAPGTEPVALTRFPDPTPEIRGIHKELVTYEREDGVPLSATLYLPADYTEGERLPLLVWAYPREFNDVRTAGQVTTSPWLFTRIRGASHLALLTRGYAILDGATMPVIGDPETMNDTFVEQIVSAARAAIEYAAGRGVADPERVGVGGHSYGAFMTANLLAHSDLFRAGVARSGAYNRTLTPFGFQAERRTFWEAPETYFSVSPFMHADEIDEPLLLIHGEEDGNSGTYPVQSERMFAALQGNGGTARLVMLPEESHGYRARESVLHVLAEMEDWFGRWLGQDGPVEASVPGGDQSSR